MIFALTSGTLAQKADCSREAYSRCVALADPLLKDPALVFPDNMADIELVCLTWNSFVDCLKAYTDLCFTREQRRQFNKAVESPIESVHMMCTQQGYQQEYLQHASCIKSTVTEPSHCGEQYSQLVEQVSQGEAISRASLCCSHDRFRRCVVREVERICDHGAPQSNAVRFAEQIIDKALSFLQDQCYNYIPNSGDCLPPSYKTEDQVAMSTSPWFSHPSSSHAVSSSHTYNPQTSSLGEGPPQNRAPQNGSPLHGSPQYGSPQTGSPQSGSPQYGSPQHRAPPAGDVFSTDVTVVDVEETGSMLGSRSRPSSYGRSSGWDSAPSPTSPSRPDWATVSTWHVYNTGSNTNPSTNTMPENTLGSSTSNTADNTWRSSNTDTQPPNTQNVFSLATNPVTQPPAVRSTTETWYPAAGSHVGNAVDEPNQLGLAKPKNSGANPRVLAVQLSFTVVATVLVTFC